MFPSALPSPNQHPRVALTIHSLAPMELWLLDVEKVAISRNALLQRLQSARPMSSTVGMAPLSRESPKRIALSQLALLVPQRLACVGIILRCLRGEFGLCVVPQTMTGYIAHLAVSPKLQWPLL